MASSAPEMQKARHVMPHPECTVIVLSNNSDDALVLAGSPSAPFASTVSDGELEQGNAHAAQEWRILKSRISVT